MNLKHVYLEQLFFPLFFSHHYITIKLKLWQGMNQVAIFSKEASRLIGYKATEFTCEVIDIAPFITGQ